MNIDNTTGLLEKVQYIASPNHDARPAGMAIDSIVIHSISLPPAQYGTGHVSKFFCNQLDVSADPYFQTIQDLKVSSHCFIDRNGVVTQFVPFHRRAWHAGVSQLGGRGNCNDYSVGIELEGTDDTHYEQVQYDVLVALILALKKCYPSISLDRIVGHSDVAPGRKTDPGHLFDWESLKNTLKQSLALNSE